MTGLSANPGIIVFATMLALVFNRKGPVNAYEFGPGSEPSVVNRIVPPDTDVMLTIVLPGKVPLPGVITGASAMAVEKNNPEMFAGKLKLSGTIRTSA